MREHELWLSYAQNDLKIAKISYQEDAILSSAFFLTQQCAEKALKAFLIFHNKPIRRIHDLVEILKECMKIDPDFIKLRKDAEGLNPYIVTYRYPDSALPFPDKMSLWASILEAERILDFVLQRI